MPNSGPFLCETENQASSQGTVTELLIMCTRTVYYCGHEDAAESHLSPSGFCSSD